MSKISDSKFYTNIPAGKPTQEQPIVLPANDPKPAGAGDDANPFDFREQIRIWD